MLKQLDLQGCLAAAKDTTSLASRILNVSFWNVSLFPFNGTKWPQQNRVFPLLFLPPLQSFPFMWRFLSFRKTVNTVRFSNSPILRQRAFVCSQSRRAHDCELSAFLHPEAVFIPPLVWLCTSKNIGAQRESWRTPGENTLTSFTLLCAMQIIPDLRGVNRFNSLSWLWQLCWPFFWDWLVQELFRQQQASTKTLSSPFLSSFGKTKDSTSHVLNAGSATEPKGSFTSIYKLERDGLRAHWDAVASSNYAHLTSVVV